MLIKINAHSHVDSMNRTWTRHSFTMKCDQCGSEFEKQKLKPGTRNRTHFCNIRCFRAAQKSDGLIRRLTDSTNIERYGVKSPLCLKEVHDKGLAVCRSEENCEKRKQTCLKRYGSETPLGNKEIHRKIRDTQTMLYGDLYIRTQEFKNKVDWRARNEKLHATMLKNGTYGKSKPEDVLHILLGETFGENNVNRQVMMNGWPIDFSVDVDGLRIYVQLDGVYWHGLDRPIETIREFKTPRDKIIAWKWETDRKQVSWFTDQSLILVRFTDKQFKDDPDSCIIKICEATIKDDA